MSRPLRLSFVIGAVAAFPFLVAACKSSTPEEPPKADTAKTTPRAVGSANPMARVRGAASARPKAQKMPVHAKPVATVPVSADDPDKGVFTLADATKGVDGKGALVATIETDLGSLKCELFEDRTPITVANFVGLARGTRPWKEKTGTDAKWVKKPAYDGTIFHRIIKGFMIQGGDAAGNGSGEPGYVIPDEIWEGAYHDRAGLLCMANRGPNTNGAQFFITDDAAAHLDRSYTIFGECAPVDLVHKIASVEVKGEKPTTPPKIKHITLKRGPSPIDHSADAAASASAAAAAASDAPPAPSASAAPAASP